jgi:signal transduction histidine kinase
VSGVTAVPGHETINSTLTKFIIVVVLSFLGAGVEWLRADFYYASAPYVYPVFYIFAAVFMGLGWGLITAIFTLSLVLIWAEPQDFLGPITIGIHILQAIWLGVRAQRQANLQVFNEGLKFWLCCGAPLLCIASYPYFLEFCWSGTTIVLQEISTNILSLLIFSIIFHSSRIRKRLISLTPSPYNVNEHGIRYTLEIAVAALIVIPAQLFLIMEYVIRDDASNKEFMQLTRTTSGLYTEFLHARSEVLYLSSNALSARAGDNPTFVAEQLAESLKGFGAMCGSFMVTKRAAPIVAKNDCEGLDLNSLPLSLHQFRQASSAVLSNITSKTLTHRIRGSDFELFILMEHQTVNQLARQLAGVTEKTAHLHDVTLENRSAPWSLSYSEAVHETPTTNRHFFSERLNERLVYEFPATLNSTWGATGLRIEFSARAFAQSKLRDTGISLLIMISILFGIMIFIRYLIKHEVEGVQQLANFLQDYAPHSDIEIALSQFEIAEFNNLKTAVIKLTGNLHALQKKQTRTVVELQNRATQLHGMVEQSKAFLLLVDTDGAIANQNKIARSKEYDFIKKSFVAAIKTHTSNANADQTGNIIYQKALEWLRSGTAQYFQEVKISFGDADDIRPLTLQFGHYGTTNITYFARIEDISEFVATKEKLAHTSRLAELGELATGVAHELSQPLNAITMSSSNIATKLDRNELTDSYLRAKLIRIQEQVARSGKIISDLKSFARAKNLDKETTNTALIITRSIEMVRSQCALDSITVHTNYCDDDLKVAVNFQQIEQVLINLFNNAKHVMAKQGGGQLSIIETRKDDKASIIVRDSGPGIDQKLRDKIFTPFYTTKISEGGTGLGLSISHKIMQDHQGSLMLIESANGASFELLIPLAMTE